LPAGTGNPDAAPRFVDGTYNDYHLLASSPCIGMGTSDGARPTDFDEQYRPQGYDMDMGAFEYGGQTGEVKSDECFFIRIRAMMFCSLLRRKDIDLNVLAYSIRPVRT